MASTGATLWHFTRDRNVGGTHERNMHTAGGAMVGEHGEVRRRITEEKLDTHKDNQRNRCTKNPGLAAGEQKQDKLNAADPPSDANKSGLPFKSTPPLVACGRPLVDDECSSSDCHRREAVLHVKERCSTNAAGIAAVELQSEAVETTPAAFTTDLEARCREAEANLAAANARISNLEQALIEARQCRTEEEIGSECENVQKAIRSRVPGRETTEILLLEASTHMQNLGVSSPVSAAATKSQRDADHDLPTQPTIDREQQQQKESEQSRHRRSRGQQRRCCQDVSALSQSLYRSSSRSSASTGRASTPEDESDDSPSSSAYCNSPATTRSASMTSRSSSCGEDECSTTTIQHGPADDTASSGARLVGPIARSRNNTLKSNMNEMVATVAMTGVAGGGAAQATGRDHFARAGSVSANVVITTGSTNEACWLGSGAHGGGIGGGSSVDVNGQRSATVGRASVAEDGAKLGQGSTSPPGKGRKGQGRHHGTYTSDRLLCTKIPVGREDEGLLLGGGRVLHKLKEELGGTLEYRRAEGVVLVHGQQSEEGPEKAAACVRTALLLSDGGGGPKAEEYAMARLCMDDLLAELIALRGLDQAGSGARGNMNNIGKSWSPAHESHPFVPTTTSSVVTSATVATCGVLPWTDATASTISTPSAVGAAADGGSFPTASVGASVVPVSVSIGAAASNLPDGEYPPEPGSLRVIGENFGCVIDVAGEVAAQAAAASIAAAAGLRATGSGENKTHRVLRPVGSATPVSPQDVLIWGPAGAVLEAKRAVAALISGNACAEVIVGAARIKRRDRGFWVNCETMASGMTVEVDLKRGSVWIRGRPEAVEDGRKDFHNKLASLFPGDFLSVPMPRAALKDLANAKGLASAASEARAEHKKKNNISDSSGGTLKDKDKYSKGYCGDEEGGVELWADWQCSCVRLRGEPAAVRCAAKALYASLAEWNTLEVSARVDRSIVTRLLSRSGRILAGISSNMGITLLVEREKGVLRGRARTEQDAKEANRVLKLKVNALCLRRPEPPPSTATPPAPRVTPFSTSPALSSVMSDMSIMRSISSNNGGGSEESCLLSEEGQREEKEITDPFDELQAFFAGESLLETSSSCSDGKGGPGAIKKRSCVFDGVEDVPSSASLPTGHKKNTTVAGRGANKPSSPSQFDPQRNQRKNGARVHNSGRVAGVCVRASAATTGPPPNSNGLTSHDGGVGRRGRSNGFIRSLDVATAPEPAHVHQATTAMHQHRHHGYHIPHPRRSVHITAPTNVNHPAFQHQCCASSGTVTPPPPAPRLPSRHTPTSPANNQIHQHHNNGAPQQHHGYQPWRRSTCPAPGVTPMNMSQHVDIRSSFDGSMQHGKQAQVVIENVAVARRAESNNQPSHHQQQQIFYPKHEGRVWYGDADADISHYGHALSRSSSTRSVELHDPYLRGHWKTNSANGAGGCNPTDGSRRLAEHVAHGGLASGDVDDIGRGGSYGNDEHEAVARQQQHRVSQIGHFSVAEQSSSFGAVSRGLDREGGW